ncbi:MAG: hypothetical protein PSV16_08445 [Flavobacterium sp.]|nr:hypothetical protein [Flavobacterium sp.]
MITTFLRNSDLNAVNSYALLDYPEESLGFQLGCFLLRNNFDFETNDIFRILTCYGGNFTEEICLQYFLFGNGRRNLLAIAYMLAGTLLEPQKGAVFYAAFKQGRNAHRFYDLELLKLLSQTVDCLQYSFNIQSHQNKL